MAPTPDERAMLHVSVDFGDSSSPQSTAVSSDSPGTATSLCFSVAAVDSPRDSLADVVPKIEETDEDGIDEDGTKPLPSPPEEEVDGVTDQKEEKKKRGRPRKYPKDVGPPKSASKGRSKTGCFTCRRRKKKCDETKPTCKHCEKNNLQCEGYPQRQVWRSGKQRASIARRLSLEQPVPLPALYEGMQRDELDLEFWENASDVLKLYPEGQEPWVDILLPMATKNAGLMHSVLCLSGTHLIASKSCDQSYVRRREHHYGQALKLLREDSNLSTFMEGDREASVEDATIAQCVVLHLASVADSRPGENYRIFSSTARDLYKSRRASNPEFVKFLADFVQYHDACSMITKASHQPLSLEDFQLPEYMLPPEACTFIGVMDGLFTYISDIKRLRDKMRQQWQAGRGVDPVDWTQATKIDAELGAWECRLENNNGPRRVARMLYQLVTWLYLHRTIHTRTEQLKDGLETGLRYYRLLSEEGSTLSYLLMPLFMLGCSAFWQEHRPEILDEFDRLQAHSNLGNIQNAKVVIQEVWEYMDADDDRCWDWEAIMERHGWEFLIP